MKIHHIIRGLVFLSLTALQCLGVRMALALELGTALKQAQHTTWGLQDGAPSHIIDMAQTSDGFLWLASPTGLYSFDGQHFTPHGHPSEAASTWDVTSLTAMENNELWVGTRRLGIVRYRAGIAVQTFGIAEGLPRSTVYSIRKDSRGQIWAAGAAGIYALHHDKWSRMWPEQQAESKPAANLWMDRSGTLCFTTDGAVLCKGAGESSFSNTLAGDVEDIAVAQDGQFWVWVSGVGVRPLRAQNQPDLIPSQIAHGHMVFTHSGDLFIMTYGHGLSHVSPSRQTFQSKTIGRTWTQEEYSLQDGLQSSYSESLFEDREGNVWVGNTKGLERFRNGKFVAVTAIGASPSTVLLPNAHDKVWAGLRTEPLGLLTSDNQRVAFHSPIAGVTAAYRDSDGAAWFGASPYLWKVSGDKASSFHLPDYVKGSSDIQAIARDRDGAIWVSVIRFGVLRYEGGTWSRFDSGSGPVTEYSPMIYNDDEGRLWIAYHGRLVLVEGDTHRTMSSSDGLSFGDVMSFATRGSVLVAGGERGIGMFRGGRFEAIPVDRDDLLKNVSGLLFSADGSLWIHGSSALLRIRPEELSAFQSGKSDTVKTQVFTFSDGLPGLAPSIRPLPSAVLSEDGRIWVSTTSGIAWIDPLHYPRNPTPPAVVLQSVHADGHDHSAIGTVRIPALTRSMSFSYTAPSLSVADGVRFRYRLDGFDTDWQEAGSRRSAFYTGLPPGRYRFHVIAANEDSVWNETGDSLEINIAPAIYQTLLFKVVCWSLALLILWIAYRTRLRLATERVRDLLAERLAERERIAGELHDTLLQSVQGLILLFHGIAVQFPEDNPMSQKIDLAISRAERLLEEGRDSVRDLRSVSFDLEDAFRSLEREFQGASARYNVVVVGEQPELQLLVCDEVFKLGREAVHNALRHAGATVVEVRLVFLAEALDVFIGDDGEGIPAEMLRNGRAGHWGLLGMRERARKLHATLDIVSDGAVGTQIRLTVPASVAYRNILPGAFALLRMYGHRMGRWLRLKLHWMHH